ncbi:relaxase/mobilization nuclease domain-containing protein [uncultured Ruegeria sp.]|uniref:relaxase/mobilization nuclease domain-containing protein n=1 Tax=uncultured Ruegeria sp. TaxID=259304 RepID=UPI00260A6F31|nr:relaxase/mobilization nuclease domain-containing protein [uncultured Ruegeria sp.]
MILKASQRANGSDLAIHLMNSFDNELVDIADLRGSVADDLHGAFAEFEAVAAGTRAEKYLYSLSINPPEPLTRDQYLDSIAIIEDRLGLTGQPRAIIFHVKPDEKGIGREHCHVVWSRIDVGKMKAIHLSHDKSKLMDCAVQLSHRFGFELPPGLKAWEEKHGFAKDKLEPTLAEKAQQDETGLTPEERRTTITQAYEQADSAEAFRAALDAKGFVLAKGDRRGFVVLDQQCNVHSLTRYIKGHKARDIKAKLAGLDTDDLPSVDQAKELIRERALQKKQGEGKSQADGESEGTGADLADMRRKLERRLERNISQRSARLSIREQELLTRQQGERLALHQAQLRESKRLFFRTRRAVTDLIGKTPGLRSVLRPLQKLTHLDPAERHRKENDALKRRHAREKLEIERHRRMAVRLETRERQALERRMKRASVKAQIVEQPLTQEFFEAARDHRTRQETDLPKGKLSEQFNDAGDFAEGREEALAAQAEDQREDEREDQRFSQTKSWKQRTDELDKDNKRRRGRKRGRKGTGYEREDD